MLSVVIYHVFVLAKALRVRTQFVAARTIFYIMFIAIALRIIVIFISIYWHCHVHYGLVTIIIITMCGHYHIILS